MTIDTMYKNMEVLRQAFDLVRLVDVINKKVFAVIANGKMEEQEYHCFNIWNRNHRCDNCISAKVYVTKKEMTKFEFQDDQVYFVIAQYVLIDNTPYVLEMGKLVDDATIFSAEGKDEFIEKIIAYNKKAYIDSLTGSYNRRYFEEQVMGESHITAIAEVDIDKFKAINDTFGHSVGDEVLKVLASALNDNMRKRDCVVRMGGDEFVLVFQDMPKEKLYDRLNDLRYNIEQMEIQGSTKLKITVSIGGCYCEQYSDEVLKKADKMLYKAKHTRNTVVVLEE